MPRIDFSNIDDVHGFSPLPEGSYFVRVDLVETTETRNGDEMWKLRLAVTSGESRGRFIFDNIVFSRAALKRAKLIFSRLGVDVSQELDATPSMLRGRTCQVSVQTEEYEDADGVVKRRNLIPFAGYLESPSKSHEERDTPTPESSDDDAFGDMPF